MREDDLDYLTHREREARDAAAQAADPAARAAHLAMADAYRHRRDDAIAGEARLPA